MTYRLCIKNMVCSRCRMVVESELHQARIPFLSVTLGEAILSRDITVSEREALNHRLKHLGFELIDDKRSRLIEKIKNHIISLVHHTDNGIKTNLSDYLSEKLHYDYTYLSNLFSEVENTTIEKYFIAHRIEKIKELLVYNELTLSEIAHKLGYSSASYLSSQFKKATGFTPSYYKSLKEHKRRNIEEL